MSFFMDFVLLKIIGFKKPRHALKRVFVPVNGGKKKPPVGKRVVTMNDRSSQT